MYDYRSLISYIYEYEGKEKGKNVVFVKLESRNGQCRMSLSVKKVYVGGNAIGVYLLNKNGGEAFLGNIFIRNGIGEFRATVDTRNVEGNGDGLDTYYGLTVHDVKNAWRSYTTIWEDAVAPVTQIAEAKDVRPGIGEIKTDQTISRVVKEIEEEITREEGMTRAAEVGAAAKAPVFSVIGSPADSVEPQESGALPEEPSVPGLQSLNPEEDQDSRTAGVQASAPCPPPSAVRLSESGLGGPPSRNPEPAACPCGKALPRSLRIVGMGRISPGACGLRPGGVSGAEPTDCRYGADFPRSLRPGVPSDSQGPGPDSGPPGLRWRIFQ